MLHSEKVLRTLTLFIISVALLTIVGFTFIYSSSSVYALERHGAPHYFVINQLKGLFIGLIAMACMQLIPTTYFRNYSSLAFLGALGATVMTLIPKIGISINGSKRWIALPGLMFQPSELLKVTLVIYLSYILTKKQYSLNSFIYGYLPFMCILAVVSVILLKQPDFGQTVTVALMAFLLLFIARASTKHIMYTLVPLIPTTAMLVVLKPYRFKRILTFLNPWQDPTGSGFQIIQSLIAIGSGGFWGLGISNSKQKYFYLPMQHTDFIFSIIAEETGLIGSICILGLYALFLYTGIKLSGLIKDPFAAYVVLGYALLITIQALINLAVVTGLVPTKGIGLPFISYGASSLVSNLLLLGIVIQCVLSDEEVRQTTMGFARSPLTN